MQAMNLLLLFKINVDNGRSPPNRFGCETTWPIFGSTIINEKE